MQPPLCGKVPGRLGNCDIFLFCEKTPAALFCLGPGLYPGKAGETRSSLRTFTVLVRFPVGPVPPASGAARGAAALRFCCGRPKRQKPLLSPPKKAPKLTAAYGISRYCRLSDTPVFTDTGPGRSAFVPRFLPRRPKQQNPYPPKNSPRPMRFHGTGPLPRTPVFPGIGRGLQCARAAVRSFHRGRPGAEKMINYCCYPEEKAVFQFAKHRMSAV